jgi:hypothetical protein
MAAIVDTPIVAGNYSKCNSMAGSATILSDQYWWISFSLHHWNAKVQHWPLGFKRQLLALPLEIGKRNTFNQM